MYVCCMYVMYALAKSEGGRGGKEKEKRRREGERKEEKEKEKRKGRVLCCSRTYYLVGCRG